MLKGTESSFAKITNKALSFNFFRQFERLLWYDRFFHFYLPTLFIHDFSINNLFEIFFGNSCQKHSRLSHIPFFTSSVVLHVPVFQKKMKNLSSLQSPITYNAFLSMHFKLLSSVYLFYTIQVSNYLLDCDLI